MLIVFAATVAYAISMLVRNTGGSLGVGFVYFAVAELGIRLSLFKYGPDVYLLSGNVGAWLVPGGSTFPARNVTSTTVSSSRPFTCPTCTGWP